MEILKTKVKGNKVEKSWEGAGHDGQSSAQQQGPIWSTEWMNVEINAELWQSAGNKKIRSRIR